MKKGIKNLLKGVLEKSKNYCRRHVDLWMFDGYKYGRWSGNIFHDIEMFFKRDMYMS